MTSLLQLNTSMFSSGGQSSQLTDEFVSAFRAQHSNVSVELLDLGQTPVPHLTAERFAAFLSDPLQRTPEQQAVVDYSDALIAQLRRADVIALGLPMYNFGVPSVLRAYFDHVARAKVTFRYTEQGPEGLLKGKKVYVLSTRGGRHAGTASDSETRYVRDFLGFLGMDDVEFVYAEGLGMGEEAKQAGLAAARHAIQQLTQVAQAA
jgi:FMN-dependent NADH-azoreductase